MKLSILILTMFSTCAMATSTIDTFYVQLGSDTISQGDVVEVKFVLQNMEAQIEAPDFSPLALVSGPNQSSSFQFINGQSSSTVSQSYFVTADQIGNFFIAPAYARLSDGTTHETQPKEIIVLTNDGSDPTQYRVGDSDRQNELWQGSPFWNQKAPPLRKKKLKTTKI